MRITPIAGKENIEPPVVGWPSPGVRETGFQEFLEKVSSEMASTQPVFQPIAHTVKRGENLWQICRDNLTSQGKTPTRADVQAAVARVAKASGLRNPDILTIGQRLDMSSLCAPTTDGIARAARPTLAAPLPARNLAAFDPPRRTTAAMPEAKPAIGLPQAKADAPTPEIKGGLAMPDKKPGLAMPELKPGLAMPDRSAEGGPGGVLHLPKVLANRVVNRLPPILPHATTATRSPSLEATVRPAMANKNVDITGLMQSLLEPGAFAEPDVLPGSPWSRVLGGPARLTSGFGMRSDPFTGQPQFHQGLDIAASKGTEIYPYMPGKVTFSGWQPGYGKMVVVEHPNGMETIYGHASKNLAKVGDIVTTDTPIAEVGATGRATGPHLHFEVRRNDVPIDPMPLLAGESLHVAKTL